MKHLLLPTIAALVLLGCGAKRNMQWQWANVKIEPAYALASDLSNLHGYTVISNAIPLSKKSRVVLSRILTNTDTYFRHSVPPDCLFRPGVAFHFTEKNIKVDLLVCFNCKELRYYQNGQIVGTSYFRSHEFLKFTKKLFPDDKNLQSLK